MDKIFNAVTIDYLKFLLSNRNHLSNRVLIFKDLNVAKTYVTKAFTKNYTDNKTNSNIGKQTYNRMTPVENSDNLNRKPVTGLIHRHSNPASTYSTGKTLGVHNQVSRTRTSLQDSANGLPRIKIQT